MINHTFGHSIIVGIEIGRIKYSRSYFSMTMNFKFDGDRLFFTSDTHFNHTNILRYCNRPFKTVGQMNETIITNWNNVVGPDDVIFHLGDFCLGGAKEWNKIYYCPLNFFRF